MTVVSGMALGIDSAAHEGALEGGARTVAVLACGPEYAYPPRRRPLHGALVEQALVISELPPGTTPYRWAFPARNRIIAALAEMTVVVEAAERSGSLITAEIALDLGREVGAVPGAPAAWHSAGANALLRDGARVVRSALDVIDDVVGVLPRVPRVRRGSCRLRPTWRPSCGPARRDRPRCRHGRAQRRRARTGRRGAAGVSPSSSCSASSSAAPAGATRG